MEAPELGVSPDCPKCGGGNTWAKQMLSREYEQPKANVFCKNCRTEFYAPPHWYSKDDWKEELEWEWDDE